MFGVQKIQSLKIERQAEIGFLASKIELPIDKFGIGHQ